MGAALAYLDRHLPDDVALEGLTLGTPINASGPGSRIRIQGDFRCCRRAGTLQCCFCIEALAHSNDPARFFASAGRLLMTGGQLIVIDDVVMHNNPPSRALETYRAHWLAPGVQPMDQLKQWANDLNSHSLKAKTSPHGFGLDAPRPLIRWINRCGDGSLTVRSTCQRLRRRCSPAMFRDRRPTRLLVFQRN